MARALSAERTWQSALPPPQVWAAVLDFPAYPTWWPWLEEFDPPPLATGAVTHAVVRAPARYRLRLRLALGEVDPPRRARIDVDGHLGGQATVSLRPEGDGTELCLRWSLRPQRPLLRALAVVAHPVLVNGHDWILDDGLHRFTAATGLDLVEQ